MICDPSKRGSARGWNSILRILGITLLAIGCQATPKNLASQDSVSTPPPVVDQGSEGPGSHQEPPPDSTSSVVVTAPSSAAVSQLFIMNVLADSSLTGNPVTMVYAPKGNIPDTVTNAKELIASKPAGLTLSNWTVSGSNLVTAQIDETGTFTGFLKITTPSTTYLSSLVTVNITSGNGGTIAPETPIVPNLPDGTTPTALLEVSNDTGVLQKSMYVRGTVPFSKESDVRDQEAWIIGRYFPAANSSTAGTIPELLLGQVYATARFPRQNSTQTAVDRPTRIGTVQWIADLRDGVNYFALYRVPTSNSLYQTLLQSKPFALSPIAQSILQNLKVRHYGPHGDIYESSPASKSKIFASGPNAVIYELNGITRPIQGTNPLPHGVATKIYVTAWNNSPIVRAEVAIMNGFTGQTKAGGWNNLSGTKTIMATSAALYADKITLEIPIPTPLAIAVAQPDSGRNSPADLLNNGIRLFHSKEQGAAFPIKDYAYLVRTIFIGPSTDSATVQVIANQPLVAITIPAQTTSSVGTESYQKHPLFGGIPVSRSDLQGANSAQFNSWMQGVLANRLNNVGDPPTSGAKPPYVKFGTYQVPSGTMGGGNTSGTDIGTLFPVYANIYRGKSLAGLRYAYLSYLDQSDQGAYVMFNAVESDPRAYDVWRPDYGLVPKYGGDLTLYQPISKPWDLSVYSIPNIHPSYWIAERDWFQGLPSYQEHISNVIQPSWRWIFDQMAEHDRAHQCRNRAAHAACYILGMPSACFSVRALAAQSFEGRTLAPLYGPVSGSAPWGQAGKDFNLLSDKTLINSSGPNAGNFSGGRIYGWTLWDMAQGPELETDTSFLSYMENHLQEESALMLSAMVGDFSTPQGPYALPWRQGPYNKDSFALSDGSSTTTAWYIKNWNTAIMAYGVFNLRSYFSNSPLASAKATVTEATHSLWNYAVFNAYQVWAEGSGGPATGAPFGYSAVAGACNTSWSCSPLAKDWKNADPSYGALLYFNDDPTQPTFLRNSVGYADSYYMGDLIALYAAETGDSLAYQKVKNQNNQNSNGYGVNMSQYYWWLKEVGKLN